MIKIQHLTKSYNGNVAVDDLSLEIESGRIYGLLGPNGAGKSTTMNIMTGYIAATSGTVLVNGIDIFEDPSAAKKYIGYLPEQPPLYPDMTVAEYLRFAAELKEVLRENISAQVIRAMEQTGCADVQHRLIKNLSKGYRQRVGIAQALLGDPQVIILDEPTVGLDPKQILEIRELITDLGKKHTVILSSHILQEVSAVCDDIFIISHGKLVAHDTPENLGKSFRHGMAITLSAKCTEAEFYHVLSGLGELHVTKLTAEADTLFTAKLECENEEDIREKLFFAFAEKHIPIYTLTPEKASLEDIFLELTSADDPAPIEKEEADA